MLPKKKQPLAQPARAFTIPLMIVVVVLRCSTSFGTPLFEEESAACIVVLWWVEKLNHVVYIKCLDWYQMALSESYILVSGF